MNKYLLGVIIVIILYMVYSYFFKDHTSANLVGMHNAKQKLRIEHTSLPGNSSSVDFTFSIWLYINDWNYRYGDEKIILIRQDVNGNSNPRIYLANTTNDLHVDIQCYDNDYNDSPTLHTCSVKNIKMQKWVHVVTVVNNRTLDIYVDGKLVRTCLLPGVPKLDNEADISITPEDGFSGFTSNIEFYNYVLNPQDVWDIYSRGYGGSLLGNILGRYRAKLSFYEDNVETSSLNF